MPALHVDLSQVDSATLATTGAIALGLLYAGRLLLQNDTRNNGPTPRPIHWPESTLPVLGNILDIAKGDMLHHWILEQNLKFKGEPWHMKIPGAGMPRIMLFTPEAYEEVTTTQFDNFIKGQFQLERIEHLLGRGLVASDGERWHRQRKAGVKFFSAKTLRAFMTQAMKKNMGQLQTVLDTTMQTGGKIDLLKLFHDFTIQTFMEMGLGIKLQWIGSKEPHPFEVAVDRGTMLANRRFRVPSFVWKMERWLNIGHEKEMAQHLDTIYTWMNRVVQESLERVTSRRAHQDNARDTSNAEVKSVVELFVEQSSEDAEGLRPEDLVEFILTFVLAARDTTAVTLSWMLYALSINPHVEEALRDELAQKIDVDKDTYLTTEHVRSLTFLEATIKETLRLYPAVPYTMREAVNDTFLCGDIYVKKGQVVGLSAYSMGRNPMIWGLDVNEFKPERWIDQKTGELINIPASKFFSFSAGPRTCIGMTLAMMEVRVITANLLRKYRFTIDPSNDGSYVPAIGLNMKHPLLASVRSAE
ncbi:hypothetical protein Poli38472_008235 [Pythium oligandrum]|uniref:Cytochrome P450 n=1 Tax=Pythium oligandrum TaxID=41045 RepID=A0A8K1FPG2_PYTOL|nr:hypothetical protein Poli38472_008235 [Pythium oligandrum]|eukprot:TMW65593.1 hypothetical protein Poli38472_008235 [Pythium oligandrum]